MSNLLGLDEKPAGDQGQELDANYNELAAQTTNGASWFYWIAGLSAINSVVYLSGSDWSFLAGLGLTQLADGFVDAADQFMGGRRRWRYPVSVIQRARAR